MSDNQLEGATASPKMISTNVQSILFFASFASCIVTSE